MVGEDTHLTGGGGDVDLGTVVAKDSSVFRERRKWLQQRKKRTRQLSGRWSVKRLKVSLLISTGGGRSGEDSTYLVRQGQGELDLVGNGLGVSTALDGGAEHGGTSPKGRASEAEGVHRDVMGE